MPCGGKLGKILRGIRKQYPDYGEKRLLKIAWGIYGKQKRKRR